MLSLAARSKVKVIAETYKLDEINRDYDRVETGRPRFRAVLRIPAKTPHQVVLDGAKEITYIVVKAKGY